MFSVPTGTQASVEIYEGLPSVVVHDPAEEWEKILDIIYNPWYVGLVLTPTFQQCLTRSPYYR